MDSVGLDPKNLGFDVNIGGASRGRPRSYYGNHPKYKKNNKDLSFNVPHLEDYYDKDVYLTEALTLKANKEIAAANAAQKPFMLYMSHYAVWNSDPRFAERYKHRGQSERVQAFATLVEGMDKSLGDITAKLEALGIAEDTLIVFLGDNGSNAPIGKNNDVRHQHR